MAAVQDILGSKKRIKVVLQRQDRPHLASARANRKQLVKLATEYPALRNDPEWQYSMQWLSNTLRMRRYGNRSYPQRSHSRLGGDIRSAAFRRRDPQHQEIHLVMMHPRATLLNQGNAYPQSKKIPNAGRRINKTLSKLSRAHGRAEHFNIGRLRAQLGEQLQGHQYMSGKNPGEIARITMVPRKVILHPGAKPIKVLDVIGAHVHPLLRGKRIGMAAYVLALRKAKQKGYAGLSSHPIQRNDNSNRVWRNFGVEKGEYLGGRSKAKEIHWGLEGTYPEWQLDVTRSIRPHARARGARKRGKRPKSLFD